jgi:hypothetical protein
VICGGGPNSETTEGTAFPFGSLAEPQAKAQGQFPHLFKSGVAEILNLQPRGSLAKPYQVKRVRAVIVRYKPVEGAEWIETARELWRPIPEPKGRRLFETRLFV